MGIPDFGGRVEKDGDFAIYILKWLAKSRSQWGLSCPCSGFSHEVGEQAAVVTTAACVEYKPPVKSHIL